MEKKEKNSDNRDGCRFVVTNGSKPNLTNLTITASAHQFHYLMNKVEQLSDEFKIPIRYL